MNTVQGAEKDAKKYEWRSVLHKIKILRKWAKCSKMGKLNDSTALLWGWGDGTESNGCIWKCNGRGRNKSFLIVHKTFSGHIQFGNNSFSAKKHKYT